MTNKIKLVISLIFFVILLSSCGKIFLSNGGKEEINQKSSSLFQDRGKEFLKTFSQEYPTFELIDYAVGSEENAPIR